MTNSKETTLEVSGMTCGSCVRHVEEALRKLDGINAIEVKLRDGKVRVRHDPTKAPLARLIEVLDDAGYVSYASTP